MELIINKKRLTEALRATERITSRSNSLPILSAVLLKAKNNEFIINATNLELGIKYTIPAKIQSEGEIAVPAKVIADLISNVSDEKIQLSIQKQTLIINGETFKTTILGMATDEFPILPSADKEDVLSVSAQTFKNALNGVISATALTETRPELYGVFMGIEPSSAALAATDSFRLAESVIDVKASFNKSIIIPRNTVLEIIKSIENNEGEVLLVYSNNQVFLRSGDIEIISRIIDAQYPDYKKVIPNSAKASLIVNKQDLEKNIKMASIFSSNIADLTMKVSKNLITLIANNNDRGNIITNIQCETKNEPFELSLNYNYILDGLKAINSDKVKISFTGQGSPFIINPENNNQYTYLIMPLRGN